MSLSHVDNQGKANMVDVSDKTGQKRIARATGKIMLSMDALKLVKENQIKKGDVITVAEIAGIQGAKQTSTLIPLCHNLMLGKVAVNGTVESDGIRIDSEAVCVGQTGVEMEALTAVSVALLTIYDMCKAVDKSMTISNIHLTEKTKQ
jgi:cyclic pyranopterin phosphate synthase